MSEKFLNGRKTANIPSINQQTDEVDYIWLHYDLVIFNDTH
jgi:hypothetical protein